MTPTTTDTDNIATIRLALGYGWQFGDADEQAFTRTLVGDEPPYSGQPPVSVLNGRMVREDPAWLSECLAIAADNARTFVENLDTEDDR